MHNPNPQCEHCTDMHDGFMGSYADKCPYHKEDGSDRDDQPQQADKAVGVASLVEFVGVVQALVTDIDDCISKDLLPQAVMEKLQLTPVCANLQLMNGTQALRTAIAALRSAQQMNESLQKKVVHGSSDWHVFESIDDKIHDALTLLGD